MASSTITVWLPAQESQLLMGGLPDGMTADVWTGGEQLPDSADEVEVVVLPCCSTSSGRRGTSRRDPAGGVRESIPCRTW